MAISAEDITTRTFKIVKKGFSTEQVSSFLDMLAGEVVSLQQEINRLSSRVETLEKQVKEYDEKENAINKALYEAGEIRQKILAEAEEKKQAIIDSAYASVDELLKRVNALKKEEEQIKERIRYVLESQLAILNSETESDK